MKTRIKIIFCITVILVSHNVFGQSSGLELSQNKSGLDLEIQKIKVAKPIKISKVNKINIGSLTETEIRIDNKETEEIFKKLKNDLFIEWRNHQKYLIEKSLDTLNYYISLKKKDYEIFKTKLKREPYNNESGDYIYKLDSLKNILGEYNYGLNLKLNEIENIKNQILTKLEVFDKGVKSNSIADNRTAEIKNAIVLINGLIDKMNDSLEVMNDFVNEFQVKIVKEINEHLATESTPKENSDITTIPEFITNFGAGQIMPSFNLLGSQDFNRGNINGNIKLFSTALIAKDQNKNFRWQNTTLPESSNFGFQINLFKRFAKEDKKLTNNILKLSSNYVSKAGQVINVSKDTSNFTFGVFHFKPGYEYIVAKDVFSIYVDFNAIYAVTDFEKFIGDRYERFGTKFKKPVTYFNTGLRVKINTAGLLAASSNSKYIIIDLNFIWLDSHLKQFGNTSDRVLPILKTGFKF